MSTILGQAPLVSYLAAGLFVAFGLVRLGHSLLALLRDLREFREGR